ncbi:MAG: hypothetical protein SXQ77_02365, partial [Halobacteria archaeon]|nr:hypothetical protein [Halobacteria archaeon]
SEDDEDWYDRFKDYENDAEDMTTLQQSSSSEFDVGNAEGADEFDREVETYTAKGDFTPAEGLDSSVLSGDTERVHILVQFTFDDPKVDADLNQNLTKKYDLAHCGSYMDASGWENARCLGIPRRNVEAFASEEFVLSVTPMSPELKMYPELETQVRESDEGTRLIIETYPDVETNSAQLNSTFGVRAVREYGNTYSTKPVSSYSTVQSLVESEMVKWVGWYRPTHSTLDDSREHVGANEVNGDVGTAGMGLNGEGQWVGVLDSGIQGGHSHYELRRLGRLGNAPRG